MKRILCPTDFSPPAEAAMAKAEQLARALGAELVLLHVTSTCALSCEGMVPTAVRKMLESQREWVGEALVSRVAELSASGVPARTLLRRGQVWEEIIETAREEQADMIVMGTEGRTGFNRVLLGSVAEAVVRHAPCPVMTVRGSNAERKGTARCA